MDPRQNIFSVVTPSFGQGRFIRQTIESVFSQSGDFYIDYVVFDACSVDETVPILKEVEKQIESGQIVGFVSGVPYYASPYVGNGQNRGVRFRWYSEPDKGQTDAINKGISIFQGSVFSYLNSDDLYFPGAFAAALEVLTANPTIAGLYGEGVHFSVDNEIIELYPSEPFTLERLSIYCPVCQPTVFLRKSTIDKVGKFNVRLKYCMDYEYWLRILEKNLEIKFVPKILAGTRLYDDAKTLKFAVKVHSEIVRMQARLLKKVSEQWLDALATHKVANHFRLIQSKNKSSRVLFGIFGLLLRLRYNRALDPSFIHRIVAWFRGIFI